MCQLRKIDVVVAVCVAGDANAEEMSAGGARLARQGEENFGNKAARGWFCILETVRIVVLYGATSNVVTYL